MILFLSGTLQCSSMSLHKCASDVQFLGVFVLDVCWQIPLIRTVVNNVTCALHDCFEQCKSSTDLY